jgi:hypothetical protein
MSKIVLLVVTVLCLQFGAPQTRAAVNITVDFFYDQLGDYGDWVEVGDYGYGWQPRDVDRDWRPYADGQWVYTDAGWTWISDEPYGWAVYHYGRWVRVEGRGWIWIPGTEWAPAWVSWRRSPRHIGWAPLPPEASFRRSVGFSAWVDTYYDIGPGAYRFVPVRDFGAPRLRTVFVDPVENVTIIRQTTNITHITYTSGAVFGGGPRYEEVVRESAQPVRRLKLDRRVEIEGDRTTFRGEKLRSREEGDALRVFAPAIAARATEPPPKVAAKVEKVEVNHGWKDAGPAPDVEKLRTKMRAEAKVPKDLPAKPKFEKLAAAEPAASPAAQPPTEKPAPTETGPKGKAKGRPAIPDQPGAIPPSEPAVAPGEKPPTEPPAKPRPGKGNEKSKATGPAGGPETVPPDSPKPEPKGKAPKSPKNAAPKPVEPKVEPPHEEQPRQLPPPAEKGGKKPKQERPAPPVSAAQSEPVQPPKSAKPKNDEPKRKIKPQESAPAPQPQMPPPAQPREGGKGKGKGKPDNPPPQAAPANAQPAPSGDAPKEKSKGKGKKDKN